ncbi:hypothetical protein [Microbacterium sp. NPDC089695]|uniref:hypothetical protein n=1 Tax=Microbacterium sp. NPDC089695 TaxID=3364198 RepID=UPI00381FC3CF
MADSASIADNRTTHVLALIAIAAGIVVTVVFSLLKLPETVTAVAGSATTAIPAVIGLSTGRRRRDRTADLARLRRGELRRPVSLAVVLLGVAILACDSLIGVAVATVAGAKGSAVLLWTGVALVVAAAFAMSVYASHYLGPRPYAMASMAVAGMIAARIFILTITLISLGAADAIPIYLGTLVLHVFTLGGVLLGVWVGRRRQAGFVAAKADRLSTELDDGGTTVHARATESPVPGSARADRPRLRYAALRDGVRRRPPRDRGPIR